MEAKLDNILANMVTTKDLEKMSERIEGRLEKVEEAQVFSKKARRLYWGD